MVCLFIIPQYSKSVSRGLYLAKERCRVFRKGLLLAPAETLMNPDGFSLVLAQFIKQTDWTGHLTTAGIVTY